MQINEADFALTILIVSEFSCSLVLTFLNPTPSDMLITSETLSENRLPEDYKVNRRTAIICLCPKDLTTKSLMKQENLATANGITIFGCVS